MSLKVGKTLGSGKRVPRKLIRKAARLVAQGTPAGKAMIAVGYSESTADHRPKVLTEKPEFKEELALAREMIAESCVRHKVTIDRLVQKVSVGLDAKSPMSGAGGMLLKLNKDKKNEMQVTELGHGNMMIDDHDAQVKWWDRAAVLLGIRKDDDSPQRAPVNVTQLYQIVIEARRERGLGI
jgi:hypothetical protein